MQFKFVDLLLILLKHKKTFLFNGLLFSIVAIIVSLLLPFWYTSTSRLMPPESQQNDLFSLASLVTNIPVELPGLGALGTGPSDLYLAIMRSRNVRVAVLEKLDLQKYFEADFLEDALQELDSRTHLDKTEENIIVVSCTERSPEFAQKLVNTFLTELDRVNREVRKTSATQSREFIEKRLTQADADLRAAADGVVEFQKKYGAFDIEQQVKTQIETIAQLRAEAVLLEIERETLESYVTESHSQLKQMQIKSREMLERINDLQKGVSPIENDLLLALNDVPELGKEYLFLQRDVEVQRVIYQLLMQQFEQSKIQEAKDSPTIQILDEPTLAQKRSSPKRGLIVVTSALASIILSFIIVWWKEIMIDLRATNESKHAKLRSELKSIHRLKSGAK